MGFESKNQSGSPIDYSTSQVNFGANQLAPFVSPWMGSKGRLLHFDAPWAAKTGNTEQSMSSYVIPANTLVAGTNALRVEWIIYHSNSSGGSSSFRPRLKLGGTTIADITPLADATGVSNISHSIKLLLIPGASGNLRVNGDGPAMCNVEGVNENTTAVNYQSSGYFIFPVRHTKMSGFNFATDNTLDLTIQLGSAVSQSAELGLFAVELLQKQS